MTITLLVFCQQKVMVSDIKNIFKKFDRIALVSSADNKIKIEQTVPTANVMYACMRVYIVRRPIHFGNIFQTSIRTPNIYHYVADPRAFRDLNLFPESWI